MALMALAVILFALFPGCALYDPGSSDTITSVKNELVNCKSAAMGFGVGKMPCCATIDENGKCTSLVQLEDGITYARASTENSEESCSINAGTCTNINLKKWNTSAMESTAETMENKTINLCPTFAKSVCMENCTTGIFRDISINENPGLSAADMHQLRLIYGDNGTKISNNTKDSSLSVKRLNLLYSEGSYQRIDDQVASDLKGKAVMDIFRFGVGKTFSEFDEAQLLLPFSTEEIGEVSQSGVESFPLYYYPKADIQNCAMDMAQFGYVCKNSASAKAYNKVFPTFESCLLNCAKNSNRLRPSSIDALGMIMRNRPTGKDAMVETFYVQSVPPNIPPSSRVVPSLTQIRTYVNSMGTRPWQPVVRKNVSEYLLDEFGPFGDSFTITTERLSFMYSTASLPFRLNGPLIGLANVYYQADDVKKGYADITSRYDSTSYNHAFTLVDGKKKPGLPFECSGQDCKSGICSYDSHYRTACVSNADINADINCGCDTTGCFFGSYGSGKIFSGQATQFMQPAAPYYSGAASAFTAMQPDYSDSKQIIADGNMYMAVSATINDPNLIQPVAINASIEMNGGEVKYNKDGTVGTLWAWHASNLPISGTGNTMCKDCIFRYESWPTNGQIWTCKNCEVCSMMKHEDKNYGNGVRGWQATAKNLNTISSETLGDYTYKTQLFCNYEKNVQSGCDKHWQLQYECHYMPLTLSYISNLISGYNSNKITHPEDLPLFSSCGGMKSDDSYYVCINPRVLNNAGANIGNACGGHCDSGDWTSMNSYLCRKTDYVNTLEIARRIGGGTSVTSTSSLGSELGSDGDNYCRVSYNNFGTTYGGTFTAGDKGSSPCDKLTAEDFCFGRLNGSVCMDKESLVMVLYSPGPDNQYGNCKATNGYSPDVREYGMCENPSYVNLAVQMIAPDRLYFSSDANSTGYIPASYPAFGVGNYLSAYADDPKGSKAPFSALPNFNNETKNASPNFWPPYDYLKNKTRSYLQGGISVMLFAEHPDLYRYCEINSTYGLYCRNDSAPPFMSKLLSDIYNKSNTQKFVALGSAIVVTGRATPTKQECQPIQFSATESLSYCHYYKDEARYSSTYYATTKELDMRNRQVKDMCPGCRTAVEIAGNLRDTGSGFAVETQSSGEGDMLQMTFKRNPVQINLTDIYDKYGVTQRPGIPNPGTVCSSGAASGSGNIAMLTAHDASGVGSCGIGYRAKAGMLKYGEGDQSASTTIYVTTISTSYKLPNGTVTKISGPGAYTAGHSKACSTIKNYATGSDYCYLSTFNSLQFFDFVPDLRVWYTTQVAVNNGWKGDPATDKNKGSCQLTHDVHKWNWWGGNVGCPVILKTAGKTVYTIGCNCATASAAKYTKWNSTMVPGLNVMLPHKEMGCSAPTCAGGIATIGETCTAKPGCINMPSFVNAGTCTWMPNPQAGCNSCVPSATATRVGRWGGMQVNCDTTIYPLDFIGYYNPTINMYYKKAYGDLPAVPFTTAYYKNKLKNIENEIKGDNTANSQGIDFKMCNRDSDIRTYSLGEDCNDLFKSTDMIVLNLEIDPATTRHSSSDYEAWYTEMADAIINYSSAETYTYGKPIIIYIRDMKDAKAKGFDSTNFMKVLGLNMERMINAGVVAIQFEDWKKATADNVNAYTTDSTAYNNLLYPFDASGAPTSTFTALSELGKAISKKINVPVPKATPVLTEASCLNSTIPCIADNACISKDNIGTKRITCYNGAGAVKITYAMNDPSVEDMGQIFTDPAKYRNVISSVNRYSNRKICNSSMANSTYFMSYMSNAGYGIPLAWDQLQAQNCTAIGLTNAEMLSFVTGGAADYVCRLE
jgi:hypothetical protein